MHHALFQHKFHTVCMGMCLLQSGYKAGYTAGVKVQVNVGVDMSSSRQQQQLTQRQQPTAASGSSTTNNSSSSSSGQSSEVSVRPGTEAGSDIPIAVILCSAFCTSMVATWNLKVPADCSRLEMRLSAAVSGINTSRGCIEWRLRH